MNRNAKTMLIAGICGLVLPLAAGAAEDVDSTHAVPADGLVQVQNMAGRVEISTWDRAEAQVRGRVGDDVEKVIIEETSNGLRVEVKNRKNKRQTDPTELYLKIPVAASVEVEGVSADLSLDGSRGERIVMTTVSGDVEIEAEAQRVNLTSVSGDVEFEGSAERVEAESVSGDVTLVGVRDEVEASTVSGDVVLEADVLRNGRFETVSGDLDLVLELADGGRLNCDAMSGDVNLKLPSSQQAAFTAQTFSGEINSVFGDPMRQSNSPSGSVLKASVGDNGARIRLETFSGDISIRTR